ncbi:MAG: potassium-transporting ATPase KdpC subunit [Gaiellales bacterium]|nr:potassium-transporting ATPase KdpC subunit [Gaiellales bacterium]
MRKTLTTSALAILLFTLLLGVAYPLLITGAAQVAFPGKADGSQLERGGKVVGSSLLAQDFTRPVLDSNGKPKKDADGNPVTEPDPRYFQPRPSATGWNPSATFFANRGPNQRATRDFHRQQLDAYLGLERPYNPGLTAADVPVDAVTDSASGVDPHISEANARIQTARIATVRHLPLPRVRALVGRYTDGRSLGFFGEPGVNMTELNLALDREAATP